MSLFSRLFEPSWRGALRRGRAALDAGRWADAWREHHAALGEAPGDDLAAIEAALDRAGAALVEMNLEAAEGALRAGDRRLALEAAEIASEYTRSASDRQRVAAMIERVRAERHEAAKIEQAATTSVPDSIELVDWALIVGSMPDALADRYDALPARARRAICHARTLGDSESLALLRAVLPEPADAVLGFETGLVLLQLGRLPEAADMLHTAAEADGAWTDVRLAAAHALSSQERWADAELVLQAAIDADDNDPAVWAAVVRHAVLTEDVEAGSEAVTEALRRFPTDIRLLTLQARLLELDGRHDEAAPIYESVIARTWHVDTDAGTLSFHADSAHLGALNYLRRGVRLDRAEELLSALGRALEGEQRERAELDRVWAIARQGRSAEAADLLDRVRRGIPGERALAHAWAARLAGDGVTEATLVGALNERGQRAWQRLLADRGA